MNSRIYQRWIEENQGRLPATLLPSEDGLWPYGFHAAFLPYLRAYWPGIIRPTWEAHTWKALESRGRAPKPKSQNLDPVQTLQIKGYYRYLNAAHALAMLRHYAREQQTSFVDELRRVLNPDTWLVSLDWPIELYRDILERRVETIRVEQVERKNISHAGAKPVTTQELRWSRDPFKLPDQLRSNLDEGLDSVHTPESAKAGLVRYLGVGWQIGSHGELVADAESRSAWSPATLSIPYRMCNAPRRLMLGATLLAHAVPLRSRSTARESRSYQADQPSEPPGCDLRAVFSVWNGSTHEDALVISESASRKLGARKRFTHRIAIPVHVQRYQAMVLPGASVERHQPLVRAWVDLFALGCDLADANLLIRRYSQRVEGEKNSSGWLEIWLNRSLAPEEATLVEIEESPSPADRRFRSVLKFTFEAQPDVRVGDKLATRHGVKGVVSRVLPDAEMPIWEEQFAEVLFNPVGVFRRAAMGQFREAAGIAGVPEELPRGGTLFVMRQPHDAALRWSARGAHSKPGLTRGQRFGWMEFVSLYSHGAEAIARELLSAQRSTADWMRMEAFLSGQTDARVAASQALSRYLELVGCRLVGTALEFPRKDGNTVIVRFSPQPDAFCINVIGPKKNINELADHLDDEDWWRSRGGACYIELGDSPVEITSSKWKVGRRLATFRQIPAGTNLELRCHILTLLPPWLRPENERAPNELTEAYRNLLWCLKNEFTWKQHGAALWRSCLRLALGSPYGMESFVKREVLGRRLTRSGRAIIVPDPELRPDQIRIPHRISEVIFEGLPADRRHLVLFGRNPTLQRRGLLAMRAGEPTEGAAIHVPLGVLSMMGADFDGDQAVVVALEDDSSLEAAELLLPGSMEDLRCDRFRENNAPAFPLVNELSDPERESKMAGSTSTGEQWCREFLQMQKEILADLDGGWRKLEATRSGLLRQDEQSQHSEKPKYQGRLYAELMDESAWRALAREQMNIIYSSVRKKGRLGGVLRRQFFERPCRELEQLPQSIEACQVITERMTQQALSVKSGGGTRDFSFVKFFRDPERARQELDKLEEMGTPHPLRRDLLIRLLSGRCEADGLLAVLANPSAENIVRLAWSSEQREQPADPRIDWFLR